MPSSAPTAATSVSRPSAPRSSTRPACFGLSAKCQRRTWRRAAFRAGSPCRPTAISPPGDAGISSSPGCSCSTALPISPIRCGADTCGATSLRLAAELRHIGHVDLGAHPLPLPERRRGEELQRAAEARLPRGDLRAAAARRADRARPCRRRSTRHFRSCSTCSADASRRAPSTSCARRASCCSSSCTSFMVFVSGAWNNMRSMITGRYRDRTGRRRAWQVTGLSRRGFLIRGAAVGGAALLGGCDQLSQSPTFRDMLYTAEGATERVQRLVLSSRSLAREYHRGDLSKHFKANGSTNVDDACLSAMRRRTALPTGGSTIDGLVERPTSAEPRRAAPLPVAHADHAPRLRRGLERDRQMDRRADGAAPAERGAEAGGALSRAFTAPTRSAAARKYYESIDLIDAFHPQTILAYDMNGAGACRCRMARRSGCASSASSATSTAKYVQRIEAVSSFCDDPRRPRRLLGRSRLRVVRRHLSRESFCGVLHASQIIKTVRTR